MAILGAVGVFIAVRLFRAGGDTDGTLIPMIIAVVVVLAIILVWMKLGSAGIQKVIMAERQADPQVLVWGGYHVPQGTKRKAVAVGLLKNKAVLAAGRGSVRLYTKGPQELGISQQIQQSDIRDITLGKAPITTEDLFTVVISGPTTVIEVIVQSDEKLGQMSAGKREGTFTIVNNLRAWMGWPPQQNPSV